MKKYLLKFIFLFLSFLVYGQDKWCHYYTTLHGTFYQMGEFCGDTVIDNKKYDIVVTSLFDIKDLTFLGSMPNGFRRISNDSVFFRYLIDPFFPEELYYVYNLKLNDKIISSLLNDTLSVLKVDTITLFGKDRKRIYLRNETKNYEYDDIWIEGIGTILHGYLWPGLTPFVSDLASSFSCYYDSQSGQTYAPYDSLPCHLDQLIKACSTPTANKDVLVKEKSIILPNPFNTTFDLNTREDHIEVSVYTIHGEFLKSLSYYGKQKKIDCEELTSGLYLVKVKVGNKLEVMKMVKN